MPENHNDFAETDSIINAYYALYALEDVISSDNASMKLSTLTKIDVVQGEQTFITSSYEETDDIHYFKDNGIFKYYVTADVKSGSGNQTVTQELAIDYDGSKQKIYVNGDLNTSADQGQATAKNFIFTTLKAFRKSLDSVISIDVDKTAEGKVQVSLELFVDPEIIETYSAAGFDTSDLDVTKHVLEITLDENNNAENADYSLELDGYLNANGAKIESRLIQGASISKIGSADSSLFED